MSYVNIFSNPYTSTESWSAQGAVVRFGLEDDGFDDYMDLFDDTLDTEGNKVPLIISGINMTYSRQTQQIYPLNVSENGDSTKVTIKGAPQGVLSITSIYSPLADNISCFLKLASRDCIRRGNEMWLTLRPFGAIKCTNKEGSQEISADKSKQITWRISGVELNQLGLQMQSGPTTIVQMPLNFEFTNLKISDDGDFGSEATC